MYPQDPSIVNNLRYQVLRKEAAHARLLSVAAPMPTPSLRERVSSARRDVGYRLVEAGLHLAVGGAAPRRGRGWRSRPPP